MKGNFRPTALLLALLICASAASCGNTDGGTADKAAQTQTTTTAASTETSAETEKPAETAAPTETETSAAVTEAPAAPIEPPANALDVKKLAEGIYSLDYTGDYKLDEYLEADVKTVEELDKWFMENLTNGLSTEGSEYDMACSSFAVTDADGEHLFARNYDLRPTDAMFIRTKPADGYASIGIVDLAHLNVGQGCEAAEDSAEAQWLLQASPFCICDGINEKGLGVSILQLDTMHSVTETDKHDLLLYIAARSVLDKCADVDEAVAFLSEYDMYSPSRFSYHLFLTDKSGKAVTVEWLENGQTVVEDNAVTNFVLFEAPPTRDPDGRYFKLRKALDAEEGIPAKEDAMEVLKAVSSKEGTRWSAIYDLDDFEVEACFNADYENKYEFKGTE